MVTTFPILTAFVLGLLTILDPCTLFTSITAISYIDKEIANKSKVIKNGILFDKAGTTIFQYPIGNSNTEFVVINGTVGITAKSFQYTRLNKLIITDAVRTVGHRAFAD